MVTDVCVNEKEAPSVVEMKSLSSLFLFIHVLSTEKSTNHVHSMEYFSKRKR